MNNQTSNIFDNQVSPEEGCTLVIFGASGDLAKKKLFPSLYQLYKDDMLPKKIRVVGYARTKLSNEEFIARLESAYTYEDKQFYNIIEYVYGGYDKPEDFNQIQSILEKHSLNRIFYFSLPPMSVRTVCRSLQKKQLITENSGSEEYRHTVIGEQPYTRLVLEKPFGEDLESAVKLERFLYQHFTYNQIFIIDHYLGKEPLQNILFFRFTNALFENVWNGKHIESIQLTMYEDIGVENRAGYFDSTGMLRDMVQSHGLQMLALLLMEPPNEYKAKAIRREKSKLLQSLRPFTKESVHTDVVRAQYDGYLSEDGVGENSKTETLVAMKTFVDNWRWGGVPIFIRSAKATTMKRTELVVNFKKVAHNILGDEHTLERNRLVFRLQPETFIKLRVSTKVPGNELQVRATDLDFPYAKEFEGLNFVNGYDRIIFTALMNNPTLFLSVEEVIAQWVFIDSIRNVWNTDESVPLYTYKQKTTGPKEIDELINMEGEKWNT